MFRLPFSFFFFSPPPLTETKLHCCPWIPVESSHSNQLLLVDQWRGSLYSNRLSEKANRGRVCGPHTSWHWNDQASAASVQACFFFFSSSSSSSCESENGICRRDFAFVGSSRAHIDVGTSHTSLVGGGRNDYRH